MADIREPAVAGRFYPADAGELREAVLGFLEGKEGEERAGTAGSPGGPNGTEPVLPPRGLIAPHAGYVYSGGVAGTAYRYLRDAGTPVDRVVLLGPAHFVHLVGVAAPSHRAFRTPLGEVAVDRDAVDALLQRPEVEVMDRAHREEHGLEVHLPFFQVLAEGVAVVPLVVGETPAGGVADLLDAVATEPGTLVVVSTDLSHYLPYDEARRVDETTAEAVERLDDGALTPDRACGFFPLRGLLVWARRHGLEARLLDLRSSGDTAGSRDSVVGYGAFAVGSVT